LSYPDFLPHNGSVLGLKPNFRPLPTDADLSVEKYALGVANELMWALEGLTLR
jgi:hypothetical protein